MLFNYVSKNFPPHHRLIIVVSNITTPANDGYEVLPAVFDGSKTASEMGCRLIKPLTYRRS